MGHVRAALVFDLVKQPDDLTALDLGDRTLAERREHQALPIVHLPFDAAQLFTGAAEILAGDRFQRIRRFLGLLPLRADRIETASGFTQDRLGFLARSSRARREGYGGATRRAACTGPATTDDRRPSPSSRTPAVMYPR
jgi:hypothetical protein